MLTEPQQSQLPLTSHCIIWLLHLFLSQGLKFQQNLLLLLLEDAEFTREQPAAISVLINYVLMGLKALVAACFHQQFSCSLSPWTFAPLRH